MKVAQICECECVCVAVCSWRCQHLSKWCRIC